VREREREREREKEGVEERQIGGETMREWGREVHSGRVQERRGESEGK
jgi:hypothetical protein